MHWFGGYNNTFIFNILTVSILGTDVAFIQGKVAFLLYFPQTVFLGNFDKTSNHLKLRNVS